MLVKLLGFLDLFASFILICLSFRVDIPMSIWLPLAIFLVLKSFLNFVDIMGIIDFLTAALIILGIFMVFPQYVFWLAAGIMAIKGLISIF